jgi:hypothetical protein
MVVLNALFDSMSGQDLCSLESSQRPAVWRYPMADSFSPRSVKSVMHVFHLWS